VLALPAFRSQSARLRSGAALAALTMLLAGCAAIPSSGPTGAQLRSQVIAGIGNLPMTLVELRNLTDLPANELAAPVFAENYTPPAPTELVGPGDVLEIALYETGVTLFGGASGTVPSGIDPAAHSQGFPPFRVSDTGTINFPFVGEVSVNGLTTDQIEALLRRLLRGKSQNPQVLVTISEGLTNSIIIGGDVRRPGRLVLPTNRESLSDVIALAGGNAGEIKDILVRIQREGALGQFRMSDILAQPEQDIRIFPADRILLVHAPQSFSVLGAAGRRDQIAFPGAGLTLAEAVALAGGSNPNAGDPRAIFVFRILEGKDGVEVPTVFHLNMMEASSYILAQRFAMLDKDVLYVGNAEANQPTKLVQILSQLFYPLVTFERVLNGNN
jgi:polysaccharide export outer membrane protein